MSDKNQSVSPIPRERVAETLKLTLNFILSVFFGVQTLLINQIHSAPQPLLWWQAGSTLIAVIWFIVAAALAILSWVHLFDA